ncbi:MAG: hypothetical protein NXH75_05485, partial [Halobacteriovoraceae bacterium]|nr:hypothetical protein [Halobacteriovoraceae bacterium]
LFAGALCWFTAWKLGQEFYHFDHHLLKRSFAYFGICTVASLLYFGILAILGEGQSLKNLFRKK